MKHIAHVLIENFQSHARSELSFSKGLNVIIGPSDNGKSAVLRAIRWALYNEPRGSDFVRVGARECRVTVTMSDGAQIVRELLLTKSGAASRSRYVVKLPDAEPQVFEGFGIEVPLEVLKAHSMPQVRIDADKPLALSFGSQLEGPFLMAETGSTRARAIGRLLGVHVVDAAMRNTQKDLRTVKQENARLESRLAQYDEDLKQYDDIPAQEAALERAEALLAKAEAARTKLQKLEALRDAFDRADREEIMVEAQLSRLGDLEAAGTSVRKAEELHRDGSRLERLSQDLNRVDQESRIYRSRVDTLNALPIAEQRAREAGEHQVRLAALSRIEGDLRLRESELSRLNGQLARLNTLARADLHLQGAAERTQRLERLQEKLSQLQELQQRLNKGREMLRETDNDLRTHLAEYESVLKRLGQCPTCLQPVAPATIRKIIGELAGGPASGHHHG